MQHLTQSTLSRVCAGGWSVWAQWAQCSSECGGGIQTRTRTCQSPAEESYLCEGVLEEGRPCNSQPCTGEPLLLPVCVRVCACAFIRVFINERRSDAFDVIEYERAACARVLTASFFFPLLLLYMWFHPLV